MRPVITATSVLSFCLLSVTSTGAEEMLLAKVYRDYPGYINPALCENPNLSKTAPIAPPAATVAAPSKTAVVPAGPAAAPVIVMPAAQSAPAADAPAAVVVAPAPAAVVPAAVASEAVAAAPAVMPPAETTAAPATANPAPAAPVIVTPAAQSIPAAPIVMPPAETAPTPTRQNCSAVPYALQSDDPIGPYLTAWAGMVATNDVDIDAGTLEGEASIDNGFAGGLAVGYDFGPARVEVEGAYRNSNAEEGDAELKIRTMMLNGYADFVTGGNLTPYLGAGIGLAEVDIENYDDEVLAGQVAVGVQIAVSPKIAVDLGYRFMMTEDPEIEGVEFEVRQHTALLGVQVRF